MPKKTVKNTVGTFSNPGHVTPACHVRDLRYVRPWGSRGNKCISWQLGVDFLHVVIQKCYLCFVRVFGIFNLLKIEVLPVFCGVLVIFKRQITAMFTAVITLCSFTKDAF